MLNMAVHAYNGLTGAHLIRLPVTSVSWSDSINETGSISVTVPESSKVDTDLIYRPYGTILAVHAWGRVMHAGYLTDIKYNRDDRTYSLSGGGGGTIFEKRLVIRYSLAQNWSNGKKVIDEDDTKAAWRLNITGSTYSDIISNLIRESERFGDLPIIPATLTGKKDDDHERNYNSYDFATVLERIEDVGELEDGPEYRFDPEILSDGSIQFNQITSKDSGELIDHTFIWNPFLMGSGVIFDNEDWDGSGITNQVYGAGGKEEDYLVVARSITTASKTQAKGWPVLQTANTSHNSVTVTNTLKSYCAADLAAGDNPQKTYRLNVDPAKYDVHVGDWADVRNGSNNSDILNLKVTDVSGSMGSQLLDVDLRERQ